jgi:hypothetical protein
MKSKKIDERKEKLMESIKREMNLPRLTESVRNGMSLQTHVWSEEITAAN